MYDSANFNISNTLKINLELCIVSVDMPLSINMIFTREVILIQTVLRVLFNCCTVIFFVFRMLPQYYSKDSDCRNIDKDKDTFSSEHD